MITTNSIAVPPKPLHIALKPTTKTAAKLVQVQSLRPKIGKVRKNLADFTYSLFTLPYSLSHQSDFWKVISNSE